MELLNEKLKIAQPAGTRFGKNQSGICGTLRWRPDFAAGRTAAFSRAQQKLDTEAMRALTAYMPLDTGHMINSMLQATKPGSGQIQVNTPYAARVHYGRAISGKNGPLRGPYYFARMAATQTPALRKAAAHEMGAKE